MPLEFHGLDLLAWEGALTFTTETRLCCCLLLLLLLFVVIAMLLALSFALLGWIDE